MTEGPSIPSVVVEEQKLPAEGHWFAPPQKIRWTTRGLPISWAAINGTYILASIVVMLLGLTMPRWIKDLHFLAMIVFPVLCLLQVVLEGLSLRQRRRDRALSDGTPGLIEFPVEIVIVVEDQTLGIDRGVAWLENERLHFSGASTSFVLAPEDILPRQWLTVSDPYANLPSDALRLNLQGVRYVRVRPLLGYERRFGRVLKPFLKSQIPSDAARQWPPLQPYPKAIEP